MLPQYIRRVTDLTLNEKLPELQQNSHGWCKSSGPLNHMFQFISPTGMRPFHIPNWKEGSPYPQPERGLVHSPNWKGAGL